MIEHERNRRKEMWEQILVQGGPNNVSPQLIREIRMYGGAQGIWVDKTRTSLLTPDGSGIAVGLLHTGKFYPDELNELGVTYHYPKTNRPPSRDEGEINATKAASRYSLPVFVFTHPSKYSKLRNVKLGWVEDWNDEQEVFHIKFTNEQSLDLLRQPDSNAPFILEEETTVRVTTAKSRPGQQRFNFRVFERYGEKCAVCDIDVPEVLDAAHIRPKKSSGTDDPRNGIVLCSLHHRAFDAGLFSFRPDTHEICFHRNGPDANALRITRSSLNHLAVLPHNDALQWLFETWSIEND